MEETAIKVVCSNCVYADVEDTLINGQWIPNGNRFCLCEGSTANQPDSWYQLCPKGPLVCSEFKQIARHCQAQPIPPTDGLL